MMKQLPVVIVMFALSSPGFATMPVIDYSNLIESVKQTGYQIQQYKNQLDQYQNMLQNTSSLGTYNWDNANETIDNLINATDTINYYKQEAGSLDGYLNRYQSEDYYNQLPCLNCNASQLKMNQREASMAQKKANDAMLRGIDKQQHNLQQDAKKLRSLQQQAENADGQKQAIQAASQLASAENNQLLQIRGLLVAEQNAQATRAAAVANKEAIEAAGDTRFRSGSFKKSSGKTW